MTPNKPSIWWAGCALALLASTSSSQAAETLDSVQKAAIKVTEIRTETARLETEWNWQKDLMGSTIEALSKRAETLEAERDLLNASTAASRNETAEIQISYDAAADRFAAVEEFLGNLTARLVALRPWLPPRLSEALDLPYISLQDSSMTAGERMQFAATIVNRCAQFNKTITYGEEPLAIEGLGESRLVEVLYWGLSHAYALDRAGNRGYLGTPGNSGWTWAEKPGLGSSVASLIAVYRDEGQPNFVEVPAHITDPFNSTPTQ
jgi:hypothetical protein